MKKFARKLVVSVLGWQVRRLRNKNDFKIIGVVGSIGKTSTKFAIAKVLEEKYKVRYQEGNYNDLVTVPLIFFDFPQPSLLNPIAWLVVFIKIEKILTKKYPYEVVIAELGTDGPNQIIQFSRYIQCDISVLTAISMEHMEFFNDLDSVAEEELSISKYTNTLIINKDLCTNKYLISLNSNSLTYGTKGDVEYKITNIELSGKNNNFTILNKSKLWLQPKISALSKGEVYSATAAAIIANELELDKNNILEGISNLSPVSGRMLRLKGIKKSLIIDETYNSSPEAVKEALETIYRISAPQKIAVLGNMNELGTFSEKAHEEIGDYCDPKQLDLVITIGKDANKYLAENAIKKGCTVISFNDPYTIGKKLHDYIKDDAVILFKGSQNGVFLEEAIKFILEDKNDETLLVRQSSAWMKQKEKFNWS